jgi:LysR family glycine cleavage system transcriptional activator
VEGVDAARGLHFNHVSLALQAAIDGQGVVLSLKPLAADDLAAGRLVIPFDLSLPVEYAYYMVCLETATERPEVNAFRKWLLDEAGRHEAGEESTKHLDYDLRGAAEYRG